MRAFSLPELPHGFLNTKKCLYSWKSWFSSGYCLEFLVNWARSLYYRQIDKVTKKISQRDPPKVREEKVFSAFHSRFRSRIKSLNC